MTKPTNPTTKKGSARKDAPKPGSYNQFLPAAVDYSKPRIDRLQTDHPGGYRDIVSALRTNDYTLTAQPRTKDLPEKISSMDLAGLIEEAINTPGSTGIVAARACSLLAAYRLPGPSDPAWMKPAGTWLQLPTRL